MSFETVTIGDATLIRGDALAVLPTLSGVDAVVTDPPYGVSHKCDFQTSGRGRQVGRNARGDAVWSNPKANDYPPVIGDDKPFDPSHLLALNVPTVLWGGNYFALPPCAGWLVWDKERPDDLDQSTCELAWTNCVKGVRRFRHLWHGMMRASEHGENYHPTQKPVALMRWVLSLRWIPRGVILDPYMGSGPVGLACLQLGLPYIGIEQSEEYFAIAVNRLRECNGDTGLFADANKDADLFAESLT